jgi:hypothetical protein
MNIIGSDPPKPVDKQRLVIGLALAALVVYLADKYGPGLVRNRR